MFFSLMNQTNSISNFNNRITTSMNQIEQSIYDDNKDIIWPTIVGIFVALALGWMICRYKCSSNDRSPHIVRCCPKSLCKRIRLCCLCIFSLCRLKSESQQQQQQHSVSDSRIINNRERVSSTSILEFPFILNGTTVNHPSITQWPPPFLLNNNNNNQVPSFPLSIAVQLPVDSSEPRRHPLRRESLLLEAEPKNENREFPSWPFQTTNMVFHNQTNEMKKNHLFFNT